MTQKEKLAYYMEKINHNEELKYAIYNNCDPDMFYSEDELADDLEFLLEGGCKQDYDLVPFMNDGCGGLYVIVDDKHIGYMDSEGCTGYIADSIEDFLNILLVFGFFYYSKKSVKSFDIFMKEMEEDDMYRLPPEPIEKFIAEEHMETDPEKLYHKLVKGLSIYPPFVIEPTDEDYCTTDNLLQMSEEEFCEFCKNTTDK